MSDETIPDLGGLPPESTPAPKPAPKTRGRRGGEPIQINQKFEDVDPDRTFQAAVSQIVNQPPPAEAFQGRRYARYCVQETIELPRAKGMGFFTLERGQVLSEQHYGIGELVRLGAKLELVEE